MPLVLDYILWWRKSPNKNSSNHLSGLHPLFRWLKSPKKNILTVVFLLHPLKAVVFFFADKNHGSSSAVLSVSPETQDAAGIRPAVQQIGQHLERSASKGTVPNVSSLGKHRKTMEHVERYGQKLQFLPNIFIGDLY
jgi:hypothetical protein